MFMGYTFCLASECWTAMDNSGPRSEIAQLLSKAREGAVLLGEGVLIYMIDMCLNEIHSLESNAIENTSLPLADEETSPCR
jgi:hypothetical protein